MNNNKTTAIFATQYSSSSMESNDQYGPVTVGLDRKPAPTLETGRRSKHLVLVGEEAARREKRRERNREAARKLKEKRLFIEEELNDKLKNLEDQHSSLQKYVRFLQQRKQLLEDTINDQIVKSTDKLLLNEIFDKPLFFEQFSDAFDLFDESFECFLNSLLYN